MPRYTTVVIPHEELQRLFEALGLWDKIQDGRFTSEEAVAKTAPAKQFPGGWSYILKHYNAAGAQTCTTHKLIDANGEPRHWDEADIKMGEVTIAKQRNPPHEGV